MSEYRVVRDTYCGYEVQIRKWWHWPLWFAIGVNTHTSLERAEAFAKAHAKPCVKYLGRLDKETAR
jgi:hypothetical protein